MGILDELLGGGQRQKEYRDFVDRYEQGNPSEGYSDQEVLKRYADVSHAVPPNQYAQAAIEALGKLSPEDRSLAEAQKFCPVLSKSRLGSMGPPEKVMIGKQPVFVCCAACKEAALANADATLAKVKALKAKK